MSEAKWFIVQSWVGKEYKVAELLKEKGYEYYLPLTRVDRRTQKKKSDTEPMLGPYLFVRLEVGYDDFCDVQQIKGVLRILRFTLGEDGALYPTPIKEDEVLALKSLENEQGIHEREHEYQAGDKVRCITQDGFHLREAIVQETTQEGRLIILLGHVLNQPLKREVSYKDVEPISS